MLDAEGYDLYFQDFQIEVHADGGDHVERYASFSNINKATLTSPQLEPPSSGFVGMLASGVKQLAGNFVWQVFTQQTRTPVSLDLKVTDEDFWNSIKKIQKNVGPNPVLLVSGDGEGSQIGSLRYTSPEELPNLDINFKRNDQTKPFYLATIDGIDVCSADLPGGMAWLFSANKLKRVQYSDKSVEVTYHPTDEKTGQLKVQFFHQIEWSEGTIYEIKKLTSEKQTRGMHVWIVRLSIQSGRWKPCVSRSALGRKHQLASDRKEQEADYSEDGERLLVVLISSTVTKCRLGKGEGRIV